MMNALILFAILSFLLNAYLFRTVILTVKELEKLAWEFASLSVQKRSKGTKTPKKGKDGVRSQNFDNDDIANETASLLLPRELDRQTYIIEENRKEGVPTRLKDLLEDDAEQV